MDRPFGRFRAGEYFAVKNTIWRIIKQGGGKQMRYAEAIPGSLGTGEVNSLHIVTLTESDFAWLTGIWGGYT